MEEMKSDRRDFDFRDCFGREPIEEDDPLWWVAVCCTALLVVGFCVLVAGMCLLWILGR